LGGGFGRKSKPDYVAEAAVLSKKLGRPVKVVWTREDDIKFDYYNAVAAMYLKAAVDEKGKPTAWLQRSVFPPITSTFDVNSVYGDPGHLQQGWTDLPYDLPAIRIENGPAPAHVRIGWLRSVANIYHAFGVQCFTDELAHRANRDPVEYMLDLIGSPRTLDFTNVEYPNYGADYKTYPWETGRLRKVIEMVADKSGWAGKKSGKGHGFGFAAHRSFLTYVATVVEVEVSDDGEIRIPRVDTAVDAGLVVNPEITRAQFEGAAVFGTSIVRTGEITAKNGAIQQSNFNDYPVARINEVPAQTNVYLTEYRPSSPHFAMRFSPPQASGFATYRSRARPISAKRLPDAPGVGGPPGDFRQAVGEFRSSFVLRSCASLECDRKHSTPRFG